MPLIWGHFCGVGDLVRDLVPAAYGRFDGTRIRCSGKNQNRPARRFREARRRSFSRARVEHCDIVCMKPHVSRHQRESLMPRLGDEEPVEWITVMHRKARDSKAMVGRESEHTHTGADDVCVKVVGHRKLSEAAFTPISANETTLNASSAADAIVSLARSPSRCTPESCQSTTWVSSSSFTQGHRASRRSLPRRTRNPRRS